MYHSLIGPNGVGQYPLGGHPNTSEQLLPSAQSYYLRCEKEEIDGTGRRWEKVKRTFLLTL